MSARKTTDKVIMRNILHLDRATKFLLDCFSNFSKSLHLLIAIFLPLWFAGWFFYFGEATNYRNVFYLLIFLPLCCICVQERDRSLRLSIGPQVWATFFFILVAMFSLFYQIDGPSSTDVYDAIRFSILIIVFVVGTSIVRVKVPSIPIFFITAMIVGGLASSAWFLGSYYSDIGPAAGNSRLDPGLAFAGNTNRIANLYAPMVICGIVLAFMGQCRAIRSVGWVASIVGIAIVFWTQSRSGLIGTAITIAFLLFVLRRWYSLGFSVSIFGLVAVLAIMGDIGSRDLTEYKTIAYRLEIYEEAFARIAERPILGEGWMASTRVLDGKFFHAHNIFLNVWLQGGVVGLAGFLWVVVATIYTGWRQFKQGRSRSTRITALTALGFVAYYLITGMVIARDPFSNPDTVWLLFWFPVALITGELAAAKSGDDGKQSMVR